MKEVGERVILEAVEQKGCEGCFFCHDDTCYGIWKLIISKRLINHSTKDINR